MKYTILLFGCLLSTMLKGQIDTIAVEQITVTATRASQDDPLTIQNINKTEIEEVYIGQNPSALLEQLSPSIVTYGDGGNTLGNYVQIRMRGISQSRVNMTLNGVPLNDMMDQGTFFSNFGDFGNSISSIQVHRGVGTSNNGVASFAGAVNFEGPQLRSNSDGVELQSTVGSFGTGRIAMEGQTGMTESGWSFYGRGTHLLSDGYKINSGTTSNSMFLSGGYFGAKDWVQVTAFAGSTQNGQAYLPVLRSDIDENPRTNYNWNTDVDDFSQELIQLKYTRLAGSNTVWNTTAYYGGARGFFPFSYEFGGLVTEQYGVENNHYGIMSDVNYDNGSLNLKAGIHAYTFDRENLDFFEPDIDNPFGLENSEKREFSVFAKANYDLGSINLFADVQLRNVAMQFSESNLSDRNNTFINPKIGINFSLAESTRLYVSYGLTSREPTRSDVVNSGGSIENESVSDLELGYQYSSDQFQIQANVFHMDFNNEIALVGRLQQNSYIDIRTNVENSQRTGLELQSNVSISDKIDAGLIATFMQTNVDSFNGVTDVENVLSPKWIVRPQIGFAVTKGFKLNLNGLYISDSFIELSNQEDFIIPSFFILNAQADVQVTSKFGLTLSANNIFDQLYFTDGSVVDTDFDGIPEGPGFRVQPPANFYIMGRVRF